MGEAGNANLVHQVLDANREMLSQFKEREEGLLHHLQVISPLVCPYGSKHAAVFDQTGFYLDSGGVAVMIQELSNLNGYSVTKASVC